MEDLIQEFETLQDFLNENGKGILARAITRLRTHRCEDLVRQDVVPAAEVVIRERRSEERDPMESEQHLAEHLGLTAKPRGV